MKQRILILILSCFLFGCGLQASKRIQRPNPPANMLGQFVDDYGIKYTISEDIFLMVPNQKFHILEWNLEGQFLLARNDEQNKSDGNLYSRIDYMTFEEDMKPFQWGFCISTFNATSLPEARKVAIADRANPKSGCNGYPFSRMKPVVD